MKYEQFLADVGKTRDEVEGMGRTLSRVKSVLSAAHDLVGKNERLEKENAELRDELDDWKGNAEGFQPDSYMKLPLDADGVPIHIGDTVWYIGVDVGIAKDYPLKVDGFVMEPFDFGIFIETQEFQHKAIAPESLTHEQPEPADSWEKPEEDASVGAQDYCANWLGIDIRKTLTSDDDRAFAKDIIRRAKKLAGIEEEARNDD